MSNSLPPPRRATNGNTPQVPPPLGVEKEPALKKEPEQQPQLKEGAQESEAEPTLTQATPIFTPKKQETSPVDVEEPLLEEEPYEGNKRSFKKNKKTSNSFTSRETRNSRKLRGNIVAAAILSIPILAGGYLIFSIATPPPSAEETASIVQQQVNSDGTLSTFEGVGAEFLRAYLTHPIAEEATLVNNTILNSLSQGEGAAWRAQPREGAIDQRVIGEPILDINFTPSATTPGGLTGLFRAQIQSGIEPPRTVRYAVTVIADSVGFAYVASPPALINLDPLGVGEPVTDGPAPLVIDSGTSAAATPGVIEYLKVWAQAGADADPGVATQLQAWLATDATATAQNGLNGELQYNSLIELGLQPLDTTGKSSGYVIVSWIDTTGRTFTQKYGITVGTGPDGKFQIADIGPA
jgi:hypothetical protein